MPLSDREQQILADIEARLRADDPKLAKTVGTVTVSSQIRRRIKLAIATFALGFVLLLAYPFTQALWVGVAGFALMLAGVVVGGNEFKRLGQDADADLGGQVRGGMNRYLGDRRRRNGETHH